MKTLNRLCSVLMLLLLGASPGQQNSKQAYVPGGYLSVGEFSDLSPAGKEGYVMGFFNGMMASAMMGADGEKLEIMHSCIHPMASVQVAAVLEKYVKDHPEIWHESLSVHSLSAVLAVCPDLKKKFASGSAPH